uniref:Potassium channel tetramerisation-type BTB domain-containing protein n=1 Tax=Noctiluca scintillans TaxID=2966 RepID=A0A7S1AKF2_NOCSC|mmetsp:Transcript_49243/g.130415  ORF Transcript_49243/g.130415 Transcript_49243/m.130415 type:complete len:554 (+) Transcript_49243:124-1785(+)|eukprot:CAMPEP_0194542304 /NCGR_PEP_ID=MMETSP0253-20130528/83779_1 /TAXON_ID=2966 /ORGANISM="Noctiluca scintillans" /LENGTH=553 /DNA_ID=CAMNT_0039388911 /DNA_START=82 /DNA_END=1743 /DNA_ORIENTATION=+
MEDFPPSVSSARLDVVASSEMSAPRVQTLDETLTAAVESARVHLEGARNQFELQVDVMRQAEKAIAIAAERVHADRRALDLERREMLSSIHSERARHEAEIVILRRSLEQDRKRFQDESGVMSFVAEQARGTVLLDVGGVHHKTSLMTLTSVPGSMLETMFSGRHMEQLERDESGRIFIDRNGHVFGHILEFLRNPSALSVIEALSEAERRLVRLEAHYLGLEKAMFPDEMPDFGLMVLGGVATDFLNSTEVFRPFTNQFEEGPSMGTRRNGCASVMLDRRRLVVIGGRDGDTFFDNTEVLDLEDWSFTDGPVMHTARWGCAAVMIDDRRMLVVGGYDGNVYLDTTEVLDTVEMRFELGPQMGMRHNGCAAVMLDSRRLLVLGGHDGVDCLQVTEVLDVYSMVFQPGPELNINRNGCAAVMLDERRLFILGGHDGNDHTDSTEILDTLTMTCREGPPMLSKRGYCAAVVCDDQLMVLGGNDGSQRLDTTEVLNEATMTFTAGPSMGTRRSGVAAAVLGKPLTEAVSEASPLVTFPTFFGTGDVSFPSVSGLLG